MGAHLITGGTGFIGINLAHRLAQLRRTVILVDDLSRGCEANLAWLDAGCDVRFARADCSDPVALLAAVDRLNAPPITEIWHLAANSDIAAGSRDLRVDLRSTLLSTTGVLLMLQERAPTTVHFTSSSAVYGDHGDVAASEAELCEPISQYGAMKLASEAQLRAAVESFVPKANVFRLPNIVGAPATHGVVLDFVDRLLADPARLTVQGDGRQRKPSLHVSELVDAMLFVAEHAQGRFNVFNVGPRDDGISVAAIARIVVAALSPEAVVAFGTEPRGWVGDVPRFRLSVDKLAALGWTAQLGSEAAIRRAVAETIAHRRPHHVPCRR